MKKIILWILFSFVFVGIGFAYTPTVEDEALVDTFTVLFEKAIDERGEDFRRKSLEFLNMMSLKTKDSKYQYVFGAVSDNLEQAAYENMWCIECTSDEVLLAVKDWFIDEYLENIEYVQNSPYQEKKWIAQNKFLLWDGFRLDFMGSWINEFVGLWNSQEEFYFPLYDRIVVTYDDGEIKEYVPWYVTDNIGYREAKEDYYYLHQMHFWSLLSLSPNQQYILYNLEWYERSGLEILDLHTWEIMYRWWWMSDFVRNSNGDLFLWYNDAFAGDAWLFVLDENDLSETLLSSRYIFGLKYDDEKYLYSLEHDYEDLWFMVVYNADTFEKLVEKEVQVDLDY